MVTWPQGVSPEEALRPASKASWDPEPVGVQLRLPKALAAPLPSSAPSRVRVQKPQRHYRLGGLNLGTGVFLINNT